MSPLTTHDVHRMWMAAGYSIDQFLEWQATTASGEATAPESGARPHPEILRALHGRSLAGPDTRVCKRHPRQQPNCIDCWSFRRITFADITWCGICDPSSRLVETVPGDYRQGMTFCPRCHPKGLIPAELEAAKARAFSRSTGQGKDYALPRGDRE